MEYNVTIKNAKQVQSKAKTHQVSHLTGNTYEVTSGASGNVYTVTAHSNGATCSCAWASYRPQADGRSGCSHVISVYGHIEAEAGRKVSAWATTEDARRQHRPLASIGDGITLTSRVVQ